MQVGNQGYHVLEKSMLEEMLSQRAPWFNGSIGPFRWRMIVRFERRLAEAFGSGRTWLVGDAAHLAGPVGMQSMNVGIHEGELLAQGVADVIGGKSDTSILRDYGQQRQRAWRQLMGLDLAFSPTAKTDPLLSRFADRLPSCLPANSHTLADYAHALGFELTVSG